MIHWDLCCRASHSFTWDRSPFKNYERSTVGVIEINRMKQDVHAILKLVVVHAASDEYFNEKGTKVIPGMFLSRW